MHENCICVSQQTNYDVCITVALPEYHEVSSRRPLDCFLNNLFRLKTFKPFVTDHFVRWVLRCPLQWHHIIVLFPGWTPTVPGLTIILGFEYPAGGWSRHRINSVIGSNGGHRYVIGTEMCTRLSEPEGALAWYTSSCDRGSWGNG